MANDDLFSDENIPESNFFKFSKVGDRVGGELVEIQDKPAKGAFPAQRIFTLKLQDGGLMNVGIPLHKDYVISRAATAKLGDNVGFMFKAEIPSQTAGFAPAKSIEVYVNKVSRIATDDLSL